MDFHSLMEQAQAETACSQLFVHFAVHEPAWTIMQRIEELGGRILEMKLRESDRKGYRIGLLRLANENIQDLVIALSENGLAEIQGIGRRTAQCGGPAKSSPGPVPGRNPNM